MFAKIIGNDSAYLTSKIVGGVKSIKEMFEPVKPFYIEKGLTNPLIDLKKQELEELQHSLKNVSKETLITVESKKQMDKIVQEIIDDVKLQPPIEKKFDYIPENKRMEVKQYLNKKYRVSNDKIDKAFEFMRTNGIDLTVTALITLLTLGTIGGTGIVVDKLLHSQVVQPEQNIINDRIGGNNYYSY